METHRFRYFCTIAETGSLTKASEILGISHSGLSKAISVLESETNLKLFRPLGRGLEITNEGKWFYQKAQQMLKIENEISLGVKTEKTSIRIGLSEVVAISCAGILSRELRQALTILEADVGEAEGNLLGNEIDFGIVFSPSPKPELEYLELGEVKFNSFARTDLIKTQSADLLPFTVPSSHLPLNPMGYKARDGWPQKIKRLPYITVSGFSIALDLLKAGESAVYMPDFVAFLENEKLPEIFQLLKIPAHKKAESKRKLFLVKAKNSEETKEMKKAAKVLRKICCSEN